MSLQTTNDSGRVPDIAFTACHSQWPEFKLSSKKHLQVLCVIILRAEKSLGSWIVLFASLGKSARVKFISVKSGIISIYLVLIILNKIGMTQIFLDIFETAYDF